LASINRPAATAREKANEFSAIPLQAARRTSWRANSNPRPTNRVLNMKHSAPVTVISNLFANLLVAAFGASAFILCSYGQDA